MIKQNIVFIENKAGSLQKVTGLLNEMFLFMIWILKNMAIEEDIYIT